MDYAEFNQRRAGYLQKIKLLRLFDDDFFSRCFDGSPVGKLMHDFNCSDPDCMFYAPLADRARYFKKDLEGVQTMCKIFEDFGKEMREEGAMRNLLENIKALMKNLNYTVDQAMDVLNVPAENRADISSKIAMP